MIEIFVNMQAEETSNDAKKSNETKTIAVKRKRRTKNTTKKTTKRPATPSNALNPACILSATDSFHHDSIQNNVTKRKKKRSKSTKKNISTIRYEAKMGLSDNVIIVKVITAFKKIMPNCQYIAFCL